MRALINRPETNNYDFSFQKPNYLNDKNQSGVSYLTDAIDYFATPPQKKKRKWREKKKKTIIWLFCNFFFYGPSGESGVHVLACSICLEILKDIRS